MCVWFDAAPRFYRGLTGYCKVSPCSLVAYTQAVLGMIEVDVQPGPAALVFIAPQSVTAPAGGQVEFQVRAFDVNQNPLPARPARWSVLGNIGHIDPDTGGFTATHMGQGKVQAEIAGQVGSVDVQVRHGAPDADKSRLVATRLTVPADGKTATDIIVRVQDRFGNPIIDAQVTLISTRADQIDQPVPTDQHGVALGHIRSVDPGRSEIRAVIGSVRISNPLNLTFTRHGVSG